MSIKNKREILERRRTIPERIFFILAFVVLAIWSAIVLCMFAWAVMSVFKGNKEFVIEPLALPKWNQMKWENFILATRELEFNGHSFWEQMFNSFWLVGGASFLQAFSVCVTGYIFAQYDFKGRETLFKIVLFIMIIPIYGALPATYKLIYDLHLDNSPLYLVTQIGGFSANMMITYGFFKGIPRTYREAVYIDGGSDLRAFLSIGLPMGKNILTAYFLLNFVTLWNNYEIPLLYFDDMPTLALGLFEFQNDALYAASYPMYFAGALIAMLPILLIFVFFADKLMGQMYSGGLKG